MQDTSMKRPPSPYRLDMLCTSKTAKYDLSGFVKAGKTVTFEYNGKQYSAQKYGGKHANMYTVTGPADEEGRSLVQLFDRGILQVSFYQKNGYRDDVVTIYHDGVAWKTTTWESMDECTDELQGLREDGEPDKIQGREVRQVVNQPDGRPLMEIRAGGVLRYRGKYDLKLRKSGHGVEYDHNGVEIMAAFYHENNPVHIFREFVLVPNSDKKLMIEYSGGKKDDNADILLRRPVYIGEYTFVEEEKKFKRHGAGKVLDEMSGVCDHLSSWECGKEVEESKRFLFDGWLHKCVCTPSMRDAVRNSAEICRMKKERRDVKASKSKNYLNSLVSVCQHFDVAIKRGCREWIGEDNLAIDSVEDPSSLLLDLTLLPFIETIRTGDGSFLYVRNIRVVGLPCLVSLVIGKNSFRLNDAVSTNNKRSDGGFIVADCPMLETLEIGDKSCCDFKDFEVSNTNALKKITFGENSFLFADCILRDLPVLEIHVKACAFYFCHEVVFEDLPELHTMSFYGNCGLKGVSSSNDITVSDKACTVYHSKLTMRNLPNLKTMNSPVSGSNRFHYMGTVVLENLPELKSNGIALGSHAFYYTAQLIANNADPLKQYIRNNSYRKPN